MARPNPLKMKLPPDWRKATLKILEIAACPPGSAVRPTIIKILSQPGAEEAVKYLVAASEGSPRPHVYEEVLNLAFSACVSARTAERLRRKNASKSEATYKTIKRLYEDAMAIAEQNPLHKFSIYDHAHSLYPGIQYQKLDNLTILNALMIANGLVDALVWQPKRYDMGRPIDVDRTVLVIYLTGLFRDHFEKPVSGAVGALVSATFPDRPILTAKSVQEMLTRKQAK